jgi:hypothetical protein
VRPLDEADGGRDLASEQSFLRRVFDFPVAGALHSA